MVTPTLFIWQVSAYQVSEVTSKVIIFPSVIGQYFVERNPPNYANVLYPLNLHVSTLASVSDSHMN